MTSSISDTLATVKDTVAGVKILEQDSVSTADGDSAAAVHELTERNRPTDFLDTARADHFMNYTITTEPDSDGYIHQSVVLREIPGVSGIVKDNGIIHNDAVSILIMACFFISTAIFSVARSYISRQTKKFFCNITNSGSVAAETVNEMKLNFYFTLQTCIIFAIITYILLTSYTDVALPVTKALPVAAAGYVMYFLIKYLLYMTVDGVFCEDRKIRQRHCDDICYIMTVQGLLLFPALLLSISTGMGMSSLAIYVAIVIVFAKLLAFYKTLCTFSVHYKTILQIILYFCALEMIPLMSLCGILEMIAKYL